MLLSYKNLRALFASINPCIKGKPRLSNAQVADQIAFLADHGAGMSSVVATISTEYKWSAQNNLTGGVYNPIQNSGDIRKNYSFGTAAANNVTTGGDEVFSFQQGVALGASATVNLNTMTNLLNQTSVSIVRIKGYQIRLLSATDDATLSPAPTATSTITVTNVGPALPSPLDFGNGGSGGMISIVGTGAVTADNLMASSGTGYPPSAFFLASPQQPSGSGHVFLVGTNASGIPSSVTFIAGAGGAGYSTTTVPFVPVGQYNVLTGGAHMYFDPSATGFCLVSTTSNNIKIINMDAANAITFELDVFGATT